MKIVCLDAATLGGDADLSEIAGLGEFESYEMTEPAQTAQRLAGANVRYYSTSGANDNGEFARVSLDALLRACDIISIHAPLNEKTAGLIGEAELAKMKEGAILMNFGRGGIVDEDALARAVDERGLRTALDVLQTEPMRADHPLLRVKNRRNVVITPHIAWASVEARKRLIKMIAQNIRDFMSGK